jgi:hypothetical protein
MPFGIDECSCCLVERLIWSVVKLVVESENKGRNTLNYIARERWPRPQATFLNEASRWRNKVSASSALLPRGVAYVRRAGTHHVHLPLRGVPAYVSDRGHSVTGQLTFERWSVRCTHSEIPSSHFSSNSLISLLVIAR